MRQSLNKTRGFTGRGYLPVWVTSDSDAAYYRHCAMRSWRLFDECMSDGRASLPVMQSGAGLLRSADSNVKHAISLDKQEAKYEK